MAAPSIVLPGSPVKLGSHVRQAGREATARQPVHFKRLSCARPVGRQLLDIRCSSGGVPLGKCVECSPYRSRKTHVSAEGAALAVLVQGRLDRRCAAEQWGLSPPHSLQKQQSKGDVVITNAFIVPGTRGGTSVELDRHSSTSAKSGAIWADCGRTRIPCRGILPNLGRCRPNLGRILPNLGHLLPNLGRHRQTLVDIIRPNLGRFRQP